MSADPPLQGELKLRRNDPVTAGVLSRPFDFYVGFLVTFMGLYGFLDPVWPEKLDTIPAVISTIEDIYLVTSGVTVMVALIVKELGIGLARAVVAESFAWVFIAAASVVIILSSPWIPPAAVEIPNPGFTALWTVIWGLLAIASTLRAVSMRRALKRWMR